MELQNFKLKRDLGDKLIQFLHFRDTYSTTCSSFKANLITDPFTLHRPGNSTPRYLPRKLKTYSHTKTHTQMFRTGLVTIAKRWKNPYAHPLING